MHVADYIPQRNNEESNRLCDIHCQVLIPTNQELELVISFLESAADASNPIPCNDTARERNYSCNLKHAFVIVVICSIRRNENHLFDVVSCLSQIEVSLT